MEVHVKGHALLHETQLGCVVIVVSLHHSLSILALSKRGSLNLPCNRIPLIKSRILEVLRIHFVLNVLELASLRCNDVLVQSGFAVHDIVILLHYETFTLFRQVNVVRL